MEEQHLTCRATAFNACRKQKVAAKRPPETSVEDAANPADAACLPPIGFTTSAGEMGLGQTAAMSLRPMPQLFGVDVPQIFQEPTGDNSVPRIEQVTVVGEDDIVQAYRLFQDRLAEGFKDDEN